VLGVDKDSVYNNFFRDLGGDSLSVLKVISLLRKKTGVYLTPEMIMMNTVEKIATFVERESSSSEQEGIKGDDKLRERSADIIPYYFGDPQKQLCGIYHPPSKEKHLNEGVVLCYPLPQEYMTYYSSFRQLSELLSNAGFHVLRFDYFGTGDSAGESVDININQCVSDQAAANHKIFFRDLVLWDPVLNGEAYIKEMEDIRDEMRISYMPKFREQLIGPNYDELLGYPWRPEHRDSIKRMDLFENSLPAVKKIAILTSTDKGEYKRFKDHLFSNGLISTYRVVKDISNWGKLTSIVDVQFPSKILHEIVITFLRKDK
jgi:acyl carrier protein